MSKHKCPDYCHRCPLLGGQIMPGCMGTAANVGKPHDMGSCTCDRSAPKKHTADGGVPTTRERHLEKRIALLEKLMERGPAASESGRRVKARPP
jgi:hypothetical protein